MPSPDPRPGGRYLTASGAPVQVLEVHEGIVVLQSLVSDSRFSVPTGYPLELPRGQTAFELRANPYVSRAARIRQEHTPRAAKQLAPIIDAMLLAGGKTMRGIVRELRRKASSACKGRDLAANVRARLYWLQKKGYRIENGQEGRVQVVPINKSSVLT